MARTVHLNRCSGNVFDAASHGDCYAFGLEDGKIEIWDKRTLQRTVTLR